MKIFSFMFTRPDAPIRSARVYADSREQACKIMQPLVPYVALQPYRMMDTLEEQKNPSYVLSFIGQNRAVTEPKVYNVVTHSGAAFEAGKS